MNKKISEFKKRIRVAWKVLIGNSEPRGMIAEEKLDQIINEIEKNSDSLANKYKEKIYDIVSMAVPDNKIEVMRNGCDKIFNTMIDSVIMHIAMELQEILKILNNESGSKTYSEKAKSDNTKNKSE